jgi:general secretion pathway protein G
MSASQTLILAAAITAVTLAIFNRFHGASDQDARRVTIDRMMTLMDGLENYAIDNGGLFPTGDQGLKALRIRPTIEPIPHNWEGPYVDDRLPMTDAWGMPIQYVSPSDKAPNYAMWSHGADMTSGGDGPDADIESWNRNSLVP